MEPIERTGGKLSEKLTDTTVTHDASEEITLPDYYPAIKRIVSVTARALPEKNYISEASVEATGVAAYTVVYIGEDGEATWAPGSFTYSLTAQLPPSDNTAVLVDTHAESATCRALAERKFSVKVRMKSHITAYRERDTGVRVTGNSALSTADELTLERKTEQLSSLTVSSGTVTAAADGKISIPEDARVIGCDGTAAVTEAKAGSGCVHVKGVLSPRAICMGEDGVFSVQCRVPFEEDVVLDGVDGGSAVRAWARCASVSVTVGESGGEVGCEIDITAEAAHNRTAEAAVDMYSTRRECECKAVTLAPIAISSMGQSSASVSASVKGKSTPSDVYADAVTERIEVLDGRTAVFGKVIFRALMLADGDGEAAEADAQFRCDCGGEVSGDVSARVTASVGEVKVRADPEGEKVTFDCEVFVSYAIAEARSVSAVSEVILGDIIEDGDDGVTAVLFPDRDEGEWEIAKRCRISSGDLHAMNPDGLGRVVVVK